MVDWHYSLLQSSVDIKIIEASVQTNNHQKRFGPGTNWLQTDEILYVLNCGKPVSPRPHVIYLDAT